MFHLLALPLEILDQICNEVAVPDQTKDPGDRSEVLCSRRALGALSRTCKVLQAIAQPLLFHSISEIWNFPSLFRTLAHREDLAKHVRSIKMGDWDGWSDTGPPPSIKILREDSETVRHLTQKLIRDTNGYKLPLERLASALMSNDADWYKKLDLQYDLAKSTIDTDRFEGMETYDDELCSLLYSLTPMLIPGVQTIEVTVDEGHFLLYASNSLPCLTEFKFNHSDTEWGTSLGEVAGFLEAAPNLRVLRGHMVDGISVTGRYENIKEIHLEYSNLQGSDILFALDQNFPSLETFSYDSGGSIVSDVPEGTPLEFSKAFLERRDTLRNLAIDFDDNYFREGGDVMQSLQAMQVLETLKIGSVALYVMTQQETTTDGNRLIDFLPRSIKKLSLVNPHEHIHQDILKLAQVAKNRFPSLKKLDIDVGRYGNNMRDELNKALELYRSPEFKAYAWIGEDME